jgi:hypothetical protein
MAAALGVAACGSGDDASMGAGGGQDQKPADVAGPAAQQPVPASQHKVVRTAQLSVEVGDVYAAARQAYDIGTRFGGFVADEKTDDTSASIQLGVATDHIDDALAALATLGRVTGRTQRTQDITEQVVDVQARVASQRASVERVRALLDRATAISEIVQIESELTRRQADLESLEQRAAALTGQAELARVDVRLTRPGGLAANNQNTEFITSFRAGLMVGWRVFLASTEVFLTALGALLPFLLAFAAPTAVIVWLRRRRRTAAAASASASRPGR